MAEALNRLDGWGTIPWVGELPSANPATGMSDDGLGVAVPGC